MRIAIASDHAGFDYKERVKAHLVAAGHEVEDFGTYSAERCDYPAFVRPASEAVAAGEFDRGIVLGGSGNGEAITANRVRGVRCGVGWDLRSARLMRAHGDANMLALGQRMISIEAALEIVDVFLATPFEGGRHETRIRAIDAEEA